MSIVKHAGSLHRTPPPPPPYIRGSQRIAKCSVLRTNPMNAITHIGMHVLLTATDHETSSMLLVLFPDPHYSGGIRWLACFIL